MLDEVPFLLKKTVNVMVRTIMLFACLTILFPFIWTCSAFADKASNEPQSQDKKEALRLVNIDDGISYEEAEILSAEYFGRYISGCGYAGAPVTEGSVWTAIVYFGYSGIPLPDRIIINKDTGAISMKGFPAIKNPIKEWEIVP